MNADPIGIFDSGVGGLSVLKEVNNLLPHEDIIYIADQVHVPYGERLIQDVCLYSDGIARFFIKRKTKLIVVACNTASAVALHHLRKKFPGIPFVGMEPAVKPATESTQSGVVGVLATPATFHGELYASVVERFANGVAILQDTCPGLVSQIEKGELDSPETRLILKNALLPMMEQGVDRIVLGCTHYPFVIPLIQEIVGPGIQVINPAPAVARQAKRVLATEGILRSNLKHGAIQFLTTGSVEYMEPMLEKLVGIRGSVEELDWDNGELKVSLPPPLIQRLSN